MTHASISVQELREVLAAALLALDDDELPELRVLLPDGHTREVDSVIYFRDPGSHFIELRVVNSPLRTHADVGVVRRPWSYTTRQTYRTGRSLSSLTEQLADELRNWNPPEST